MVPIDTLVSMLEEPSSGSAATASGALLSSTIGLSSSSEAYSATGAPDRRVEKDLVGDDVHRLLHVHRRCWCPWRAPTSPASTPTLVASRTAIAPATIRLTVAATACRSGASVARMVGKVLVKRGHLLSPGCTLRCRAWPPNQQQSGWM